MKWARVSIAAVLLVLSRPIATAAQQTSAPDRVTRADAAAPVHEDTRTQYPAFLANSYLSVTLGYIGYAFSDRQLEPGFHAASIGVPHVAARVAVFGHEFSPHVSAQVSYMRPVHYVTYANVNGDGSTHHVWTHFGGVTLTARVPIAARTSIYGEGGLGVTSRHGFPRNTARQGVRDVH